MPKTPLEKFDQACEKILSDYGEFIYGITKDAADQIGKAAANAVKQNAQTKLKNRPKKYHKGWTYTSENTNTGAHGWVHNKTDYQLSHLLEKGHVTRNGTGRTYKPTPAYPHIKEVEEWVEKAFEDAIKMKVSQ